MIVNLNKVECEFLSAAMVEAIAQADEEIGRGSRTATAEEKTENLGLRETFCGIKAKMDYALEEAS